MDIRPVALYRGALGSKFGIPRQSGLVPSLKGRIVFEPDFRNREALRGLEGFDRLWLIWGFSANRPAKGDWQPTVRPPRLGGNVSMGVWATRSPFRPNPLGLSCVELEGVDGMDLLVKGADLMDGTPVFDIKPYVAYADSFPEARCGFASAPPEALLEVRMPEGLDITPEEREALTALLALDPRPAYQEDPDRVYGMPFGGREVHFRVDHGILTVIDYA
jgi:tRNA-Thr(GGU) m(6)t(6)A37 methyltransferase TsaA